MRMQMRKLLMCVIGILFLIQSRPVLGREQYEESFDKEYKVTSLFANTQENFYISETWNVKNIKLQLLFSSSQIIDRKISSITLAINDHYFYSTKIPKNTNDRNRLLLDLPIEYLKEGNNTLKIYTYIRIDESLPCADDVGVANWVNFYKESSFAITYETPAHYKNIKEFYKRFIDADSIKNKESMVSISGNSNLKELNAALIGLASLSEQRIDKSNPLKLQQVTNPQHINVKNIIYFSLYDHLPGYLKKDIDRKKIDLNQKAVLYLDHSIKEKNILVITSRNEDMLIKAGKLLAYPELVSQYNESIKVLEDDEQVGMPKYIWKPHKRLTQTGEYIKGPFRQKKEFYIDYPRSRILAEGSQIYLEYRYAENLDFNRAMVTIYINDKPIGSKKLTKANANEDTLVLNIPKDLNLSGNFNLTVAFDLELQDIWCTLRQEEMPWAYITNNSMLKVNAVEQPFLLFENYPYPFIKERSFNHVIIVIPDVLTEYVYNALTEMINNLGNFLKDNNGTLEVVKSNAISEEMLKNNIITLGTFEDNVLIRNLNENLFFKFNKAGTALIGNEKIVLDAMYAKDLGTVQILDSPFAEGKAIMVVTAPTKSGVEYAAHSIGTEENLWRLYGDGLIVDGDGELKNYRFKEDNEKKQPIVQQIFKRKDVNQFVAITGLVMVLIITFGILLIRKYSKKY